MATILSDRLPRALSGGGKRSRAVAVLPSMDGAEGHSLFRRHSTKVGCLTPPPLPLTFTSHLQLPPRTFF